MWGGEQQVYLDPEECMTTGIIQHEILHALGLHHEHSRPDRNASITVQWENIQENRKTNFRVIPEMRTFGTEYDLDSLMHYGLYDFSRSIADRLAVIVPKHGSGHRLGQRKGLSVRDIAKLRNAYNCQPRRDGLYDPNLIDLPNFSADPLPYDACMLQFNQQCSRFDDSPEECRNITHAGLVINCKGDYAPVRSMAQAMGQYGMYAIWVLLRERLIEYDCSRQKG
ncbi:astacin-like metalloendopeptidase [Paramacrobiotus metropolitanus]|uniref:astacin-like metalloendopeptidase n=1 Tax=Paramacrobiotus metropolitanus TaxID=2943436 RepID=UPI0024459060|nr:astacin-like metalloendopeptidase [Paramacrobiotus metropolitanus]